MRIKLDTPLFLSDVASREVGISTCNDAKIEYVSTDSRTAESGDLFFPLKGENFDGNDFLPELFRAGVLTVSPRDEFTSVKTNLTLLDFARIYKSFALKNLKHAIAVTGSCGKTTTKELTKRLVSTSFKAHATHLNYNNRIGVSHTLLGAKRDTEVLIVEMGMNARGEIEELSRAVNPTVSIITNVGTAHVGRLGSREEIAKAKSEIAVGMTGGAVYCEKEEELLLTLRERASLSFGDESGDAGVFNLRRGKDCLLFDFKYFDVILKDIKCRPLAKHILKDLGFAMCAALHVGVKERELRRAISELDGNPTASQFYGFSDFTVWDDSYNCSYESLSADLEYASELPYPYRSLLLGDILELGEMTEAVHRSVGALAVKFKLDRLYLFGENVPITKSGAINAGFPESRIFINEDTKNPDLTAEQILKFHENGELILFKASHKIALRRVTDRLMELKKQK